jgi:hypothetical protein
MASMYVSMQQLHRMISLWRSALINQAISAAAQHYRSFQDRFALTPQIQKRFERGSKRNETK